MLSHYRLVEKIGEGGMGVVWKAEDTVLGRPVAIKLLPAEAVPDEAHRMRFLQEAKAAAAIGDAHIVGIHEFGKDAGVDFIVMEFVDGRPLNKLIHGRPLPADKVADIGHQVAHALSKAHRKGLLHRDIKPSNIIVTPEGEAKVVDFGLATLFAPHDVPSTTDVSAIAQATTLTDAPQPARLPIAGTLPYMSPEQVRGEKLDARSDIFSLGAVLYEMTTGQRPFDATGKVELAAQVQKARVVAPHEIVAKIPLDLDRLILKAMAPKPQDRYQTMEDLAVDLKRLGRELESGSSPSYDALQETLSGRRKLSWRLWAGMGAIAAAAVLAGGLLLPGVWRSPSGTGGDVTLLVLPLEVRGQTEGADYVGRAFAESIAVGLARARGVRVLPVPAKGVGPDSGATEWARLAREAGADRVLTGSLTREGDTAEASLMLVDAAENRIIWGSQQRQVKSDLPRLTSLLVREITRSLGAPLPVVYEHPRNVTVEAEMAASPETARALGALRRVEVPAALEATERLVAAFPQERSAHVLRVAALGDAILSTGGASDTQALERGLDALDRVDPANPYSKLYRAAYTHDAVADHEAVLGRLKEILERDDLAPALRGFVLCTRGWIQRRAGRIDESLADLEEARRLDPAEADNLREIGDTLRVMGRREEALAFMQQAVALVPSWMNHNFLGLAYLDLGRYAEAARFLGRSCEEAPNQGVCAAYATALHRSGERDRAREAAAHAARLVGNTTGLYNLACYYAVAGQRTEAIRHLRSGLDLGMAIMWIRDDPDLVSLHGDPEFESIVAEVQRRVGKD